MTGQDGDYSYICSMVKHGDVVIVKNVAEENSLRRLITKLKGEALAATLRFFHFAAVNAGAYDPAHGSDRIRVTYAASLGLKYEALAAIIKTNKKTMAAEWVA